MLPLLWTESPLLPVLYLYGRDDGCFAKVFTCWMEEMLPGRAVRRQSWSMLDISWSLNNRISLGKWSWRSSAHLVDAMVA